LVFWSSRMALNHTLHGLTTQKTTNSLFIAMKTSNLTKYFIFNSQMLKSELIGFCNIHMSFFVDASFCILTEGDAPLNCV
jgi:hypothetical protein